MESQDYNFDDVLEQNRGFQQSVTECTGKFVNSYVAQQINDICSAVLFLFVSVGRQCHVPGMDTCHTLQSTYLFIGAFECVRVT